MTPLPTRWLAAALLAAVAASACASATRAVAQTSTQTSSSDQGEMSAIARARADSIRYPYTAADIRFMTGMIGHHTQAITMSRWAPTHGASASVRTLAERIINAQQDEIGTMQQWLRDRQQPVPSTQPMGGNMAMNGAINMGMDGAESGHETLMPGMLTDAQMKQLDGARGTAFDRLFLTFMIQHHRGALSMVKQLFDSYGAAQDEIVFKFASDVNVDQTTEIARMERMLFAIALEGGSQ